MEQESLEIRNIKQEIEKLKVKKVLKLQEIKEIDKEIFNMIEYLYGIGSTYNPKEN